MTNRMKSRSGSSERNCELGPRTTARGGARASVESVTPNPRAISPVSARTPLCSAGPYSSRASSGPMTSRRIWPLAASVTIPSSPCPTSIRTCPVPGSWLIRGTSSSTRPAFRRSSPISARAPTPHFRPIANATSPSSWSPMVGSVTTATSAPVALRSRVSRSSISARVPGSISDAKSLTRPTGCAGKSRSTSGLCAHATAAISCRPARTAVALRRVSLTPTPSKPPCTRLAIRGPAARPRGLRAAARPRGARLDSRTRLGRNSGDRCRRRGAAVR